MPSTLSKLWIHPAPPPPPHRSPVDIHWIPTCFGPSPIAQRCRRFVPGVVSEPACEVEEAQEDDERVPFPGRPAAFHRPVSLRRHERLPMWLRRRALGWHDADAADDGRVAAQSAAGDAPPDARSVPRHARSAVQRRRLQWRDGPQSLLSLPLLAPVRDGIVMRLSPAERRNGFADDVTDDMWHAGHGRHLAWLKYCVPSSEGVRTYNDRGGWLPLNVTGLWAEAGHVTCSCTTSEVEPLSDRHCIHKTCDIGPKSRSKVAHIHVCLHIKDWYLVQDV